MDYSKIKLPCEVKRVIDWDTVVVKIDHLLNIYSDNVRIRLAGIDAPSMRTKEGKESKVFLSSILEWQDVLISFTKIINRQGESETKKDKYARYLGTLWIWDRNINQELINEWLAIVK